MSEMITQKYCSIDPIKTGQRIKQQLDMNHLQGDMLTRPIEAGASCSREAALSGKTGYPRVPRGSNDL